jgi:peptidoglycan/LPS O-acetylase OafA/YrhL
MLGPTAASTPPAVYALIRGGYLAVQTFFILSGFVLARTYGSTDWSPTNLLRYAAGRVARIYPVYLLSLLAIWPIIAADPAPAKGAQIVTHSLLVQAWFGRIPVNWNIPAWSLSCEIFFYLSFPIAAIAMARAGWRQSAALAVAATALTRVLWACGVPDELKPVIHLSDFFMGVAAARVYELLTERGWRRSGAWFYLPALALGAFLIARPDWLPPRVDLNTALRPVNALLLLGLALGGGVAARALSTRVAVYLGKASYAMYILHIPILWWYLRWARAVSASIYISAVIAVSAVVYRYVEEPANRWLRRRVQVALQS